MLKLWFPYKIKKIKLSVCNSCATNDCLCPLNFPTISKSLKGLKSHLQAQMFVYYQPKLVPHKASLPHTIKAITLQVTKLRAHTHTSAVIAHKQLITGRHHTLSMRGENPRHFITPPRDREALRSKITRLDESLSASHKSVKLWRVSSDPWKTPTKSRIMLFFPRQIHWPHRNERSPPLNVDTRWKYFSETRLRLVVEKCISERRWEKKKKVAGTEIWGGLRGVARFKWINKFRNLK